MPTTWVRSRDSQAAGRGSCLPAHGHAAGRQDHAGPRLGREVPPRRVFVIGDTPLDVACGRAIGARTIVLQTGHATRESLAATGPDLLLRYLARDSDAFFAFIESA